MERRAWFLGVMLCCPRVQAEGLGPGQLGVLYNTGDAASERVALYYASRRGVPSANVIGLAVPDRAVIDRRELAQLRAESIDRLPPAVQSLLLVWSRPYAVECMSITTAFAAGYQPGFCEPGCGLTTESPLFDSDGWLPADTVGWLPAVLLPSLEEDLARNVIDRGIQGDNTRPGGTVFLIRTEDAARNVRAAGYPAIELSMAGRIRITDEPAPMALAPIDVLAYFTGAARVTELHKIIFRPGAVADHLTSAAGVLGSNSQMSALEWLRQGATGSYGSVSEPCNHAQKFPNPAVLLNHYLRGDTLLEAYWKSVAMPGQGLFIGEPLARPYGERRR